MQNLQVTRAEFSIFFWCRILTTLVMLHCYCSATACSALVFTHIPYPMPPSCRLWINKCRQWRRRFLWRSLRVLQALNSMTHLRCSCRKYTVICGLLVARMFSDLRSSEAICGLLEASIQWSAVNCGFRQIGNGVIPQITLNIISLSRHTVPGVDSDHSHNTTSSKMQKLRMCGRGCRRCKTPKNIAEIIVMFTSGLRLRLALKLELMLWSSSTSALYTSLRHPHPHIRIVSVGM